MERWVGKVALVTGASAGIGASIAEELVKSGLKVIGLARRVERVEEIKAKLVGAPGELIPLKGDVSKLEEIESAFKWVKNNFGTIHVLVNNAGIARDGTITDGDFKQFQQIINVNLVGAAACTQQALKLMNETGVDDGHIIFINSIAGHYIPPVALPIFNVYAASKHGITAFVETLRRELIFLKKKTRVTSISPGAVETEIMMASAIASGKEDVGDDIKKLASQLPFLQSKDVADGVIYVLSTPPRVQVHEIILKPVGEPY